MWVRVGVTKPLAEISPARISDSDSIPARAIAPNPFADDSSACRRENDGQRPGHGVGIIENSKNKIHCENGSAEEFKLLTNPDSRHEHKLLQVEHRVCNVLPDRMTQENMTR